MRAEEMAVGEEGLQLQCVGEGKKADIRQNREFYILVYVCYTNKELKCTVGDICRET